MYPIQFSISEFPTQSVTEMPKQASTLCNLSIRCGALPYVADKREKKWIDPQTRENRHRRWDFGRSKLSQLNPS